MKPYIQLVIFIIFSDMLYAQEQQNYPFYVGTYTNADSQGIYKYILKEDGTLQNKGLVAKTTNPSFLAKSPDNKYLVAVNEIKNNDGVGGVESFLIESNQLKLIDRASSGGAHPCFVAINGMGYVLTANYSSGSIGLLKLNKNGKLSNLLDLQQHQGQGSSDRQKGPHAHSAYFEPKSKKIISVDLGTNDLWFSMLDEKTEKLHPESPPTLQMDDGAGPRHLAFHPNGKWFYVITELASTVTLVQKKEEITGRYKKKGSFSTLPKNYQLVNNCTDIHISADGKFVYASNRGHNSIAIFAVEKKSGELTVIGHEPTMGKTPRNFAISPYGHFLVVANQDSNNIVSFNRDSMTGLLRFTDQLEAPTPVCILF